MATNETICVALSERWRYPLSFLRLYRRVPQPGLQPRAAGKFAQYVAIKCSEYLTEAGIEPSVGSIGDADGNPLTETVNGLYKPDVIQRCGSWRTLKAAGFVPGLVDWSNHRRLVEAIGNIPLAEGKPRYYAETEHVAMAVLP